MCAACAVPSRPHAAPNTRDGINEALTCGGGSDRSSSEQGHAPITRVACRAVGAGRIVERPQGLPQHVIGRPARSIIQERDRHGGQRCLEPVLREACATAGLDYRGAELLRLGSNAVYRLASLPVIVRIARDPAVEAEMARAVGVAR